MSILKQFDLSGKVALVTGSNRGLGQAMAVGLAEAGSDIAGLGVGDDSTTSQIIHDLGKNYHYQHADLRTASRDELDKVIASVVEKLGRIDILVNNAGIIRRTPVFDFSESDWDDVMQVNLKSIFFLSQSASRLMKEQGTGKIINIASMLSYQGGILVPSYTASKHGVLGITRAMANELAPYDINVNAIAPGYIATDNTAMLRADETRNQSIVDRIPAGRWGDPDDLKGAVVFLASSASDYMHGTTVPVDGGWLSR